MNKKAPYSHESQDVPIQFCVKDTINQTLHVSQIVAVASAANYSIIYFFLNGKPLAADGKPNAIKVCYQLNELETALLKFGFIRVHRQHLVNVEHIVSTDYVNHSIVMDNKDCITFAKARAEAIRSRFVAVERKRK